MKLEECGYALSDVCACRAFDLSPEQNIQPKSIILAHAISLNPKYVKAYYGYIPCAAIVVVRIISHLVF